MNAQTPRTMARTVTRNGVVLTLPQSASHLAQHVWTEHRTPRPQSDLYRVRAYRLTDASGARALTLVTLELTHSDTTADVLDWDICEDATDVSDNVRFRSEQASELADYNAGTASPTVAPEPASEPVLIASSPVAALLPGSIVLSPIVTTESVVGTDDGDRIPLAMAEGHDYDPADWDDRAAVLAVTDHADGSRTVEARLWGADAGSVWVRTYADAAQARVLTVAQNGN